MFTNTPMGRFHRIVIVACLVVAPLLLAGALLLHPGEGEGGLIETLVNHPGRVEASSMLIIFSSLLFVPALLGILRYVPGRGTVLAHIGVGLALIGVVGHAVWAGFQIVLLGLVQSNIDRAQLSMLLEGEPPNTAFLVVMVMFLVGFFLGLILLAGGLWRSRVFPKWAAAGIGVLPLSDFLPVDNQAIDVAGSVILIVSIGAIALTVLRTSASSSETMKNTEVVSAVGSSAQPQVQ